MSSKEREKTCKDKYKGFKGPGKDGKTVSVSEACCASCSAAALCCPSCTT